MSIHLGIKLNEVDHDDLLEEELDNLVAVRRNVVLSGIVGGLSLLFGASYLIRGGSAFDVVVGLALLLVASANLPALASASTPVLVADSHGIRLRVGLGWRGLPWDSMRQVVVEHAESPLREGRLVIVPRDREALRRRLGPVAQWHLRWNKYWYGASLSVPLGMTTRVDSGDLAADLTALAAGRVEIVVQRGEAVAGPDHVSSPPTVQEFNDEGRPIPDEDGEARMLAEPEPEPELILPDPVSPLRSISTPARVDVRLEPVPVEHDEQPRAESNTNTPGWDELPVEIVIDDLADLRSPQAALIGAKVTSARELLDMSIEELSQRTRIRPHVLEAIERDDFVPCGGDFYARGHLTAISRVLGLTLDPLLALYDDHYAQAPINARRVFEADQSTGLSGGVRATLAGPRWSLLIGSVLSLTMIWGLARIFAGDPEQLTAAPDSSQTAGLAANQKPITSPRMKTTSMSVTASFAATHVVVKDRTGKVLWSGDLGLGKHRLIIGLAPFKVSADNAGAVQVSVKGRLLGVIGTAGVPGAKSFG